MHTDKSISMGVATIVASYIVTKLDLNNMYYGTIYSLVEKLMSIEVSIDTVRDTISRASYYSYVFVMMIVIAACVFLYKYRQIYKNKVLEFGKRTLASINIYDDDLIEIYMFYVKQHKSWFSCSREIHYGTDMENGLHKKYSVPACKKPRLMSNVDNRIYFYDTVHDVYGFYCWKLKKIDLNTKENKTSVEQYYIEICVTNKACDIEAYFKKIEEYHVKNNEVITLRHYKIFDGDIAEYIMYSGKEKPKEELQKRYIDTFFGREKTVLWNKIYTIHHEKQKLYDLGQYPQIGLLLYGPPGTGKSTFAYRIAMALNRHVISLNLCDYIKERESLFRWFSGPYIDGKKTSVNNLVFVLDELDIAIKKIHANSQKKNTFNNYLTTSYYDTSYYENYMKKKKANDNYEDDATKVDTMISSSKNDLVLEDLLELFQGPVPHDGCIIIATTNKYEEIYETCPALFRDGRLDAVHFDFADNALLNEITQHYYGCGTKTDITGKEVSTSQIMKIIIETKIDCNVQNTTHKYFCKQLNKCIDGNMIKIKNKAEKEKKKAAEKEERANKKELLIECTKKERTKAK